MNSYSEGDFVFEEHARSEAKDLRDVGLFHETVSSS